mmetsp:Transcript_44668/g.115580  ORF Transcript_44668/g.115580 Transcript_44668/m.115580 type:complete len:157 (-) Transcript_44668:35-505(-)
MCASMAHAARELDNAASVKKALSLSLAGSCSTAALSPATSEDNFDSHGRPGATDAAPGEQTNFNFNGSSCSDVDLPALPDGAENGDSDDEDEAGEKIARRKLVWRYVMQHARDCPWQVATGSSRPAAVDETEDEEEDSERFRLAVRSWVDRCSHAA